VLIPITPAGTKPPFFLVHGLYGLISHANTAAMARALGAEWPFYVIFARGMDGIRPPCESVEEMAAEYVNEIRSVQPAGPYCIGGQCSGGIGTIEIARRLSESGQQIGAMILVDPPPLPFGNGGPQVVDDRPEVFQQLYENAQKVFRRKAASMDHAPFDMRDPGKMHKAVVAGIKTAIAFSRFRPAPYAGATEIIVSTARAPAYLQPELPWQRILTGPRRIHVLPGTHLEIFNTHLGEVSRLMRFMLDGVLVDEPGAGDARHEKLARAAR
jgi:thioesterase domain-containing protein